MFESLSVRLGSVVSKLRNRGRLSEADVDEILGEIRTALLEADVNVGVVRSVLARIRDKAVGAEMSKALDPAQQVVKTVHAELIGLLGGETLKIT
jgi:signal recognition particle subunit SRP54